MSDNLIYAKRIAFELTQRGALLTTAESCTGGWIAKVLTDLPGSSNWFEYGFVSYGNNAKHSLLNVSRETLELEGAVSRATVKAMILNALNISAADYGIAVSGIAGPAGGKKDKPVGTVWLAWGGPSRDLDCECFYFVGDRNQIRYQAVSAALKGLLDRIENNEI
ncbi:MAG: CinA family protein [Pseudomonadota bacterium]|nr:CinA family protein [Pseudomonadota bacterium]